ncbi:peptide deformylase [uncultured Rikenella sp.]|uniref:peptide deformylase n=1 Tax=uncultured Rikenella sp. TaxID=368003 RepID=UPI0025D9A68E|nr:peptide deformylase [uncultured Rikenella sp.]
MILPIYLYGTPVLREQAREIDPATYPELQKLIDDMFETMLQADGVGLAAPQIGLPIRLFCIDLTPVANELPKGMPLRQVFINAEIYERGGANIKMNEGCLSLPGLNEDVVRPSNIRIRYIDEHLQPRDEAFDGYPARVIQHEYDHTDGMVFTDRIAPLRKNLIKSKLAAFVKGKYRASYRCKAAK